jgi:hypothetical protein
MTDRRRYPSPGLAADQRGSLFIEYLLVVPAFATMLFLAVWVYKYNGVRSEYQERVMSCAMAYAASGCDAPPADVCKNVTTGTDSYLGGALPLTLGGSDATARREETITGITGLPIVPKTYLSTARVGCNPKDGPFNTTVVATAVCALGGDPLACAALVIP